MKRKNLSSQNNVDKKDVLLMYNSKKRDSIQCKDVAMHF